MRDVNFRGLDKGGVWHYGALAHTIRTSGETYGIEPSLCSLIIDFNFNDKVELFYEFVKPETVGQWTGLNDKNNQEIYEGDIVIYQPKKDIPIKLKKMFQGVGDVVFLENNSFFYMIKVKENSYISFRDVCEIEVISNIYNNPELLGKELKDE